MIREQRLQRIQEARRRRLRDKISRFLEVIDYTRRVDDIKWAMELEEAQETKHVILLILWVNANRAPNLRTEKQIPLRIIQC